MQCEPLKPCQNLDERDVIMKRPSLLDFAFSSLLKNAQAEISVPPATADPIRDVP